MNENEEDMWDREDLYKQQVEELQEQEETDLYEEEETEEYDTSEFSDLFDDDDVADESLIGEARARLEQARLYDLLLEHDLFDGVDAIPEVVSRVQLEIKSFVEERYLVLSGMKQEKSTEVHVVQDSKFNDMEVQALKMIAAKVTKGASVEAPTSQPAVESELNTVKKKPRSNKINALGGAKKKPSKPAPTRVKKKPVEQKKPSRPARKLKKEVINKSTANKSVDDLAKKDIKYIKSLENMTLEEAGEVVKQRHPNRISKNAPDQNHINAHYQQGMAMNRTASTFATLLASAKKKD